MSFDVPGYLITEKLSENATFRVYRGQRCQDNSLILLKVLNQLSPAPNLLAPLWQEYEILRRLDFPGVDKPYALENHAPWWMIVLEDFGGRTLDQLGMAGCMEPEEYLKLALQLVEIVAEIHARQVIHKNIAPANIAYNPSTCQARLVNLGNASLISKEMLPLKSLYQLSVSLAHISPEMTGRMSRAVDYRTDYYSLGASLYELLTGTPPFLGESPLELVHAHLAIPPNPPVSRIKPWSASPRAFQILSAILLKLLSKNPEDRYQTATALQFDLRQSMSALQEHSTKGFEWPAFIPGRTDRTVELNIPQVVVGRERETDVLLQAFTRTIGGPTELVLVSGEAGIGKTTLVNQLIRPVTERIGLFLYAKYDQVRHQDVYQALIEVLEHFCWLVLSEPTSAFHEWRERVQTAVAPHGQLLTELCPQLEKVIGRQPPVEPVDEEFARPRLHQVVIRFLQAICQPDHPVVIFIDDLQWINSDSLQLWQTILAAPSLHNLLVVGAYRDNDAGPDHPIHQWANEMRTGPVRLTLLQLQNLEWSVIHKLIATALASDPDEISELTTLVYLRTEGNPYFSNEFLKSLFRDHLLAFNTDEQKWRWYTNRIEEYGVASNVVDLFVREIGDLDETTQKVLQYAACIGRRFDAATLLVLLGQDRVSSLADSLWQAMTEGLIQPLDENYRFLAVEKKDSFSVENGLLSSLADLQEEEILFEFQHDRVQQAAIAMLDEQLLKIISLQMGWLLLEKAERAGKETVQESILTIVDHLNRGSTLIEDPAEAIKLAQLNLMASNRARAVAAFDSAFRYLSAGIQLLPANSWQDQYILTLELFTAGAEVALLNGDLEQAEDLALSAGANARTPLEKAKVMKIRMDSYMIQTRLDQVFDLGIAIIEMLGFNLELREPPALIPEQAMQLPAMTEPRALEVARLDELMISAGYASNHPRLEQIVLFYIDLFSRFGNPPTASYIYVSYAVILQLSRFEQMEQGCQLGRMALELAESVGPSKTLYAVRYVYYGFVHHWWRPARECIRPLYESFQPAVESGSLWYSISMQDLAAEVSFFVGNNLEQVRSEQIEALRRLEFLKNVSYTQRLRMWSEVVLNLMGETLHPQEINGDLFGEDEAQALIGAGQNHQYMFYLYTAQAFLNFLFRDSQQAVIASAAAEVLKSSAQNYLIYPLHLFIYSLALLSAELEPGDLAARLEKVEASLRLMRLWAERVPENFLHQVELVEAEKARCLGRQEVAAGLYERAIQDARRHGYIHESALAAELAAEFYLARQDYPAAKNNLYIAYTSYLAWGAAAKVDDLANRYPEWLPPDREVKKPNGHQTGFDGQTMEEIASSIDLTTIFRASLELAQETSLEELLRKLMAILIQNTGAQNGSLVIYLDDRWSLEVQGSNEPVPDFALISIPVDELGNQVGEPLVPVSIIHYVINTQTSLVLEDASVTHQFSQDVYIRDKRPKSVLCAPLLNQGMLSGVVYLENNLAAGAFTPDRLQIVQLISSQAAVSIEKARLYENLEALVEERTRELTAANQKLKEEIDERIQVDVALRLSEARYRAVVNTQTEVVCRFRPDTTLTFVNEAYCRFVGKTAEELIGQSFLITIPNEHQEMVQDIVRKMLEHPEILENELQVASPSGETRWQHWVNTPIFEQGRVVEFQAVGFDITARKVAEEALRYNEALLRKVLEILPVGVWILDENGRVTSGNPEGQRIWGGVKYVEPQEFGEYKAWRVDKGELVKAEEWAGGLAITQGQVTLDEELEIEAFDGTRRTILNSALPLLLAEDQLAGAIVVNQDITQRKRDEEELQTAHDQLSTLLQISQSIVSTLDLDQLLNLIIEQLGKVMPYDGAAILILEQEFLKFRVIRGPSFFHSLSKYQIPASEPILFEPLMKSRQAFYLPDLLTEDDLLIKIQDTIKIPYAELAFLRSWLGLPLFARDELVGILILAHSQPDYYSLQSRTLSQAYANQVAIAIHNAQLYEQAGNLAALEERNRLARELHDSVAQALYGISLYTVAIRMALESNKLEMVNDNLEELAQLSREAMADMRLMIFELRPPILEKEGLVAALQSRLDSVEARTGLKASLHAEGEFHLPREAEDELYRIAQEALTNVNKHAQADRVNVHLKGEPGGFRLTIEDNGIGFEPDTAGLAGGQGIRNIRERAEKIGAACWIESIPGQGTKITIEVNE